MSLVRATTLPMMTTGPIAAAQDPSDHATLQWLEDQPQSLRARRRLQSVNGTFLWNLQDGLCIGHSWEKKPRHQYCSHRRVSSLAVIVTGFENSGTTILSNLLMSVPGLFGGFEGGFLLACSPQHFPDVNPFWSWLSHLWLVNDQGREAIRRAECHAELYDTLLNSSRCMQRVGAASIVDKTPGYIYVLDDVMTLTHGIPVVIARKSKLEQMRSWAKRNLTRTDAEARFAAGLKAQERALARYPERIRYFDTSALEGCLRGPSKNESCHESSAALRNIFAWLHLAWDESYLTFDSFREKKRLCNAETT